MDTIKYTGNTFGTPIQLAYYPTMVTASGVVQLFRRAGVEDATLDLEGRLVLPSGVSLTGTSYLGF
jgi:hypothetical protein